MEAWFCTLLYHTAHHRYRALQSWAEAPMMYAMQHPSLLGHKQARPPLLQPCCGLSQHQWHQPTCRWPAHSHRHLCQSSLTRMMHAFQGPRAYHVLPTLTTVLNHPAPPAAHHPPPGHQRCHQNWRHSKASHCPRHFPPSCPKPLTARSALKLNLRFQLNALLTHSPARAVTILRPAASPLPLATRKERGPGP